MEVGRNGGNCSENLVKFSAVLVGRQPPRRIKNHSATANHKVCITVMQTNSVVHPDGSA